MPVELKPWMSQAPSQSYHLTEAGARLDEPAGPEQRLAEKVGPIAAPQRFGFAGQIEGVAHLAGSKDVRGPLVKRVHTLTRGARFGSRAHPVDGSQKFAALLKTARGHVGSQRELRQLHMAGERVGDHHRFAGRAEHAAADAGAVEQPAAEVNVGRHRAAVALEPGDDGAVGSRTLQRAGQGAARVMGAVEPGE